MLPINTAIPTGAAILFLIAGIAGALIGDRLTGRGLWRVPALLSAGFFVFSLRAIFSSGALGFWAEHVRNDWNNQIVLDLLLCGSCAYFVLLARARAMAMHTLPWFLAIASLGSIGLLAMLARVLFLEEKARGPHG